MKKISALCLASLLGYSSNYTLADETITKEAKTDTPPSASQVTTPVEEGAKEVSKQTTNTDPDKSTKKEETNTKLLPKVLKEIAPYPEATQDQKRYAIFLTPKDHENLYKVELVVGKTIEVDSCNQYMIGGIIDKKTLDGFGYDYYEVEQVGMPASTMMACPDDNKHQAFVSMSAQTLIDYNSKLPIVIYAPTDVEVHYRVWSATEETINAEEAK